MVSDGRPYAHIYWEILNSGRTTQETNELLSMMMDKGSLLIQAGNQCVSREMAVATAIQYQIDQTRRSRFYEMPMQASLEEVFRKEKWHE